jgi:hypothetical protein
MKTQYTPPTRRDQRVKQDTRVWYNYLQTALYHDYKVNKEFYKLWHLSKVKKQKFDMWWKDHSHLFAQTEYVILRVPRNLKYDNAIKFVKEKLKGKTDLVSKFPMTSKNFMYQQVDEYLKCWKLSKEKNKTHREIYDIAVKEHLKSEKKSLKNRVERSFSTRVSNKELSKVLSDDKKTQFVYRKVKCAEQILKNTAKGEFTGEYKY